MLRFSAMPVCVAVLILAAGPGAADSITIDGKTYEDVYIRSGSSMYYVQIPADGSTVSIPKNADGVSEVHISPDKAERAKLLETWKAMRGKEERSSPRTMTYGQWRAMVRKDLRQQRQSEPGSGIVQLTNRPEFVARRKRGRKIFVNSQGAGIMTNRPDLFRGNEEYIEVIIHYDPIEVPEKLRRTPVQQPERAVLANIDEIVEYYADHYGLDALLLYAVIRVESNGNPYAVSHAGARGLMQLMPGTAADMGVKDIFDPAENVAGGAQYLAKMLKLFSGNKTHALAGYNAGPGNVKKYKGIPPFKETQNYVRLVQKFERQYRRQGPPRFAVAVAKRVAPGYLPPASSEYYQIVLNNGLTVPAEGVAENGPYYDYVFKGRGRTILKKHVRAIYEPS